jgi:hypothetical protein
MAKGPLELVRQVGAMLDELGIDWVLGGSLASSLFGEPRSTVDVDVAIRIGPEAVEALVERAKRDFYVPEAAARVAAVDHSAFNLLDTEHGLKVDIFVLGDGVLDRQQLTRRVRADIGPGEAIWVTAPEDQVLRKLDWYRGGDMNSDRQWRDVIGLLVVQGAGLNLAYLNETARKVGLDELLTRALAHAELEHD